MFANISTRPENFYLDPSLHSGGRLGKTGRQVKIDKKDMTDRDVAEMFHALRKLRKYIPTWRGKNISKLSSAATENVNEEPAGWMAWMAGCWIE